MTPKGPLWAGGGRRSLCVTLIYCLFFITRLAALLFHLRLGTAFPMGSPQRNLCSHQGNLQMFVNTRTATEPTEDLPFKHSDVECLLEVGFLGNHRHWARSVDASERRPIACLCVFSFPDANTRRMQPN